MSENFELHDPEDAQEYLDAFRPVARRRGERLHRAQAVGPFNSDEAGCEYCTTVASFPRAEVTLVYEEGWTSSCTCPSGGDCEHAYAAMKALLAEHTIFAVRSLSAGKLSAAALQARRNDPLQKSELARALVAAVGRPLKAQESTYVRQVRSVYERCGRSQRISGWDFVDLGLSLRSNSWEILNIWPAFPGNDHEFWLYVVNAAREWGVTIPGFMEPVSDLSRVQGAMARWQREREVSRWVHTLGEVLGPGGGVAGAVETDLRLLLFPECITLECKWPGAEAFQRVKVGQLREFVHDSQAGRTRCVPEAGLLWDIFYSPLQYHRLEPSIQLSSTEAKRILNRAVRLSVLADRIVQPDGQPLARPEAPLRWMLTPATDENDDYRLQLVQADGAPLPRLCCALPGRPSLYVTPEAVFSGPPLHEGVLNPLSENRIPAPALETAGGVQFLQSLGLPLPPRLQDRVQRVAMQIVIRAQLCTLYPGSRTEDCEFHVTAVSEDGRVRERWTREGWIAQDRPGQSKVAASKRPIPVYDRTGMEAVTGLLAPLELKADHQLKSHRLRVSKKFPELFAAWMRTVPPEIKVELGPELASLAQEAVSGRVRLDVSETAIDWFDLSVVVDVADTTLTPQEIKLLLNAKGGYVRLKDKGWRRLQFDLPPEDDERLARLGLTPHELSAEPQRLHALQLADEAARRFLPAQQFDQIHRRAGEIKTRVTPPLPAGVTAELRPYQLDGFHFLAYLTANRFGGVLADDMGLGKTLQTLAWLVWLRENERSSAAALGSSASPNRVSLVVCPKSVMDNWQAEAKRFTPGLRVRVWLAGELEGFMDGLPEADLHVINYNQLRTLGESLVPVPWRAVILDEGQYIKNPSSQTAQIARALRADERLVLTGTPIENRLLDLWSLMSFAMPGVLGSRARFGKVYDAKDDPFARRRLSARVRPFLLRRTKSQVAKDLPERIEEDLFCEIEGEQKALYRAELKRAQQMLLRVQTQKQLNKERFHVLTSLLRLRQICCHPALIDSRFKGKAESAKLNALLEQLEPIVDEGNKVLVFSQFVEMLALLREAVTKRNWRHFYLAGETENRGELIREFQSAEGAAVFLISLKAGGFGLNLTAASYVVLFDPWWNPAVENQAIDRTHRIGQVNNVVAYRLLIKDSIEEKIRLLQKKKSELAEDVLGEEKFAQSLTLDDLRYLFAD